MTSLSEPNPNRTIQMKFAVKTSRAQSSRSCAPSAPDSNLWGIVFHPLSLRFPPLLCVRKLIISKNRQSAPLAFCCLCGFGGASLVKAHMFWETTTSSTPHMRGHIHATNQEHAHQNALKIPSNRHKRSKKKKSEMLVGTMLPLLLLHMLGVRAERGLGARARACQWRC